MNSVLKNIKGANDSLPNEQIVKNHIIDIMKETFENFGYLPLETTTLCTYELLSSKYAGGAEILKEIYTLKDQGNREIGLRYDLTVPFAKVIAMNSKKEITLPFRRYEIGKVFRDGPVKVGRVREFYQCDVDLCGLSGTYPEVEILSMASLLYKKLGIFNSSPTIPTTLPTKDIKVTTKIGSPLLIPYQKLCQLLIHIFVRCRTNKTIKENNKRTNSAINIVLYLP